MVNVETQASISLGTCNDQSVIPDDDSPNIWIGASDEILEGHYVWYGIEQPLGFTDWFPGEPNSVPLGEIEDCVVFYNDWNYQWADLPCDDKAYFICEKRYVSDL